MCIRDSTITDNLILSKISDDGNAITLTNDSSTRTITGTGSLEASTLTQTPNASLTGMTGTIGSGVTFPSGITLQTHCFQSNEMWVNGDNSANFTQFDQTWTSTGYVTQSNGFRTTITGCKTGSKLLITCSLQIGMDGDNATGSFRLVDRTNSDAVIGAEGASGLFGHSMESEADDAREHIQNVAYTLLYTPPSFSSGQCTIELLGKTEAGTRSATSRYLWLNRAAGTDQYKHSSSITIQEIAG